MKCPKCDYLGFETGDRCKNCGYDFSLMAAPEPAMPDLPLREPAPAAPELPPLPLFSRGGADDDTPLIKLPAAPRAPLSVRRTPEQPRPRTFQKPPRPVTRPPVQRRDEQPEQELALHFPEEVDDTPPHLPASPQAPPQTVQRRAPAAAVSAEPGPVARRIAAALIDLSILLAIDLAVVYFTLRMASLTMDDWRLLPPVPMLAFLAILKLAYFCAFTSAGGQTIGKMAARIQVVADDDTPLDPARATRRVLAAAVSTLAFGLGFIPALIGPDRRPLHDRLARTRVIARS